MHLSRKLRYREVADDVIETLIGMSLDPRLMPGAASEVRTVRSSASTPSLRSRDGTVPPHARMDPGGNVRVVVRVRAFLPRGKSMASDRTSLPSNADIQLGSRNGEGCGMSDPHGPHQPAHDADGSQRH